MKKAVVIGFCALAVLAVAGGAAVWLRAPVTPAQASQPPPLNDFKRWAVLIVAGDNRAHSGAPSPVFDDARKDLAAAFQKIGFSAANTEQFSVNFDYDSQPTEIVSIARSLIALSHRAPAGCLIYFTSHGAPNGIIVGNSLVTPPMMFKLVNDGCGKRPAVVVMSACYSGQFVGALSGPNRVVMTAARPDRTSFGCGEMDQYTFFDDCFLRAMDHASDFAGLGEQVQGCVAVREQEMRASPPSEPQVYIGPNVAFTLRWKA